MTGGRTQKDSRLGGLLLTLPLRALPRVWPNKLGRIAIGLSTPCAAVASCRLAIPGTGPPRIELGFLGFGTPGAPSARPMKRRVAPVGIEPTVSEDAGSEPDAYASSATGP